MISNIVFPAFACSFSSPWTFLCERFPNFYNIFEQILVIIWENNCSHCCCWFFFVYVSVSSMLHSINKINDLRPNQYDVSVRVLVPSVFEIVMFKIAYLWLNVKKVVGYGWGFLRLSKLPGRSLHNPPSDGRKTALWAAMRGDDREGNEELRDSKHN